MSDFKHSIVLFTGDDGLPLEFNVRNTVDKTHLKALIEYGGGFCTQNENSVHLISPGTKVLNVDTGKKLVSSSYIYDCVKQNYLLDVNDYVFTIAEAQTSDISEENSEESLIQRHSTCKSPKDKTTEKMNLQISPIKSISKSSFETGSTTPSNLTFDLSNTAVAPTTNSSSTHSESFVEGTQEENSNVKIISHVYSEKMLFEKCKSPEVTKSPSKFPLSHFKNDNFQSAVSPQKYSPVKKEAILSSPLRRLPFSGSPKTTTQNNAVFDNVVISQNEITEQFLPVTIKSPIKNVDINTSESVVSPKNCYLSNKEAFLSSPCVPFSDNGDEASPVKTKEVCSNLLLSPKKSSNFLPNVIPVPTITKSPVKSVEANQLIVKSPSLRETFALRPVKELFQRSPSPTEYIDQLPGTSIYSNKMFEVSKKDSPTHTIVTSSQPEDGLDKFDNMLLSKIQKKQQSEDEESLSQSYTVSSSADIQVSSKPCSSDVNAPELPKENDAHIPDSPSLISSQVNIPLYVKSLEEKVEEILKKTPPLSFQDKIMMVKYICCVRKLSPATVLNSIFTDSLNL